MDVNLLSGLRVSYGEELKVFGKSERGDCDQIQYIHE